MAKCGNTQTGYFQSCDSCEEYVTCVHGIKYDRTCPDKLKWNDNLKSCERTTSTCKNNWFWKQSINNSKIHHVVLFYIHKWVSDCWSTPNEQFFSHIMARTSFISMRWWCPIIDSTRPTHLVGILYMQC